MNDSIDNKICEIKIINDQINKDWNNSKEIRINISIGKYILIRILLYPLINSASI